MVTVTRVLPWRRSRRPAAAEIADLVKSHRKRHLGRDTDLIERAFELAARAHKGQKRLSGEPYIRHPMAVADIVVRLGLDDASVAAALLHDAVEDTDVTLADVEAGFGRDVARIVDGVTKLDRIHYDSKEQQQAASARKMIVAVASDLRVLIIKLADRLHNLYTLAGMPQFKQHRIARETLDVYAPLAHRLGMQEVKQQLEDLAFAALEPRRYAEIEYMVHQRAPERDLYLEQVLGSVEIRLEELGISAEINGRPKHIWSIYEKMVLKGCSFEEIFDLIGLRVLVGSIRDCYAALGSIHATWRPVQGRFKDYIAMPKFNLYQSLHTTVVGLQGKTMEVQIRTHDMHAIAEHGVAAHWKYKKDASARKGLKGSSQHKGSMGVLQQLARGPLLRRDSLAQEMAWLSRIIDWEQDTSDPTEFMENLKIDLDADEVYVFTPKGKVLELPTGATPVDFAYMIHTEVGHSCVGAKVNGRLMALDTRLSSGDVVEVLTSKNPGAGPSQDWLKFAVSRRALNKIKQWYLRERRSDTIEQGREDLIQALRREGLPARRLLKDRDKLLSRVAGQLNYKNSEALFSAVGAGHRSADSVAARFARLLQGEDEPYHAESHENTPHRLPTTARRRAELAEGRQTSQGIGVHVEGLDDILVRLSRCCGPVPPDEIIGYVTRGRGVSVHQADCHNAIVLTEGQTNRLIEVEWDTAHIGVFVTTIVLHALDRPGLLRDASAVLTEHKLSIISSHTSTGDDRIARISFEFELADASQLDSVLSSVLQLESVFDTYRVMPGRRKGSDSNGLGMTSSAAGGESSATGRLLATAEAPPEARRGAANPGGADDSAQRRSNGRDAAAEGSDGAGVDVETAAVAASGSDDS